MAQQNLFVGSLAYATNDDSLKAHFEQVGPVAERSCYYRSRIRPFKKALVSSKWKMTMTTKKLLIS